MRQQARAVIFNPMNVLIIDDDLGIRETLGMALEASGHHRRGGGESRGSGEKAARGDV